MTERAPDPNLYLSTHQFLSGAEFLAASVAAERGPGLKKRCHEELARHRIQIPITTPL